MKSLRLSPIHDALQELNGSWRDLNGMPTLFSRPEDVFHSTRLGIADLSFLTRFGVKGKNAANWLIQQRISLPDRPNSWCQLPEGGILARLGLTEFLIEDSMNSSIAPQLTAACQYPPDKVYPILRQDLAIALTGSIVPEVLRQTCSINFQALTLTEYPVILTTAIGVNVTVIPGERNGQPFYRIWCDRTFGEYVWQTLLAIVQELGGDAIGVGRCV